jgi:hypothetical protein
LNEEALFEMRITNQLDFRRQRGTILTWKSKPEEEDDDSAISFQEKEGIKEVWRFLCSMNGKQPHEEKYEVEDDDESEILPDPTVENLPYIAREIRGVFYTLINRTYRQIEYSESSTMSASTEASIF